jgi:hypothetical protein
VTGLKAAVLVFVFAMFPTLDVRFSAFMRWQTERHVGALVNSILVSVGSARRQVKRRENARTRRQLWLPGITYFRKPGPIFQSRCHKPTGQNMCGIFQQMKNFCVCVCVRVLLCNSQLSNRLTLTAELKSVRVRSFQQSLELFPK